MLASVVSLKEEKVASYSDNGCNGRMDIWVKFNLSSRVSNLASPIAAGYVEVDADLRVRGNG